MHYFVVDGQAWNDEADELFKLALHLSRIDRHGTIKLIGSPAELAARLDVLPSVANSWTRWSNDHLIAVGDGPAEALEGLSFTHVPRPDSGQSKIEFLSDFVKGLEDRSLKNDGYLYPHVLLPADERNKRRRNDPSLKKITLARIHSFGLEHSFNALPRKGKDGSNLVWKLRERLDEDDQSPRLWTAVQGDTPKRDPSMHFFFGDLADATLARLLVEG